MLDDKYLLLFELISEANQKRIHLGGSPDESLNYFLDDIIYFSVGLRKNMLHGSLGFQDALEKEHFFLGRGKGGACQNPHGTNQPNLPNRQRTASMRPPLSRIKRLDF